MKRQDVARRIRVIVLEATGPFNNLMEMIPAVFAVCIHDDEVDILVNECIGRHGVQSPHVLEFLMQETLAKWSEPSASMVTGPVQDGSHDVVDLTDAVESDVYDFPAVDSSEITDKHFEFFDTIFSAYKNQVSRFLVIRGLEDVHLQRVTNLLLDLLCEEISSVGPTARSRILVNFQVRFRKFFPVFLIGNFCSQFDRIFELMKSLFGNTFLTPTRDQRKILNETITSLMAHGFFRQAIAIASCADYCTKKHMMMQIIQRQSDNDFDSCMSHLVWITDELMCKSLLQHMKDPSCVYPCAERGVIWLRNRYQEADDSTDVITTFFKEVPSRVSESLAALIAEHDPTSN